MIGNALEAAVVLRSNSEATAKIDKEELEEFFILSDLTIEQAKEPSASVSKTSYQKCARCWRHRSDCRREQSASGFVRSLRKCHNAHGQCANIDMKYIFFLSLPLYLLDLVTKTCVLWNIKPEQPHAVIPGFFDLVHITNTGAAFGSFKNNNTFFVGLSILALLFVVILLLRRSCSARPVARRFAWPAAGRCVGKSDRPFALRTRNRFSPFRSSHSLCASVAGLQRGRFLHLHRRHLFYHSFFSIK